MRSSKDTRRPGNNLCLLYIHSAISRVRAPDGALSSKAPDVAFIRLDNIKLIDTPVVSLSQFKCAGIIGRNSLGKSTSGIVHIVKILTKIHSVQFRTETCRPAKVCIRVYLLGSISRVGCIGGLGRN